jgi:Spy/CpxP family protein refolding chaperone
MKTSTRIIAVAAAVIALGAGGFVFAGQGPCQNSSMGSGMAMQHGGQGGHGGMRGAENATDAPARLAAVKSELKLTAAQEPVWQKFEGVVLQQAQAREALRTAMQARMQDPSAAANVDHAAQRASMMKLRETDRAARETARQELMAVLTPEQKSLADQRLSAGHGSRMAMHKHMN